jgi:hypothetical protein
MSGPNPRLSALQAQKQILVAESELNRAQLEQDWRTLADEVHALAAETRTIRSFVGATTSLVAGVASFWRKKSPPATAKPSRLQTLLASAGQISALWALFRPAARDDSQPK